jgi:hypothetical protein
MQLFILSIYHLSLFIFMSLAQVISADSLIRHIEWNLGGENA